MTTPGPEHSERWYDDLAAYALGALEPAEAESVERHLESCEPCRERLHWLVPAVDLLPATVTQQEPPPALRDRLLAVVAEEAAATEDPVARSTLAGPPRSTWLSALDRFSVRPALAGVGVALLLVAGIAGYALRGEAGTETSTYAAVPLSGSSPAEGTLEVSGDSGTLEVRNLPAAGRHEVYQAWVRRTGDGGGIQPSSVFVLSKDGSGRVAIPSGLDGAAEVVVTREPVGGSESPHESPLITAKLG